MAKRCKLYEFYGFLPLYYYIFVYLQPEWIVFDFAYC